jgi:predicted enzyme related to lactoylglutathione lyase
VIQIKLTSVPVDDQAKAHAFYTAVLGFTTKHDFPVGGGRWLTVVSPAAPDGIELLLEPTGFDFARTYQKSLYDEGVPWTAFACDDIEAEYARMSALGVVFRAPPKQQGPVKIAVFDDTCGNLIQLFQT